MLALVALRTDGGDAGHGCPGAGRSAGADPGGIACGTGVRAGARLLGLVLGLPGVEMVAPTTLAEGSVFSIALGGLALPQLSLTLTNAILLTAIVMQDSFGDRAAHVTPRRLALTTGIANLLPCAARRVAHVPRRGRCGGAPDALARGPAARP